jgi:hypothetical protein
LRTTLAEAKLQLTANPRPIICLDTCDFLDVARGLIRNDLSHAKAFVRMRDALAANPPQLQLVITYLVRHEWEQDRDGVQLEIDKDLQKLDEKIGLIGDASKEVGLDFVPPVSLAEMPLVQKLNDLAEALMSRAMILEKDGDCIERALDRLMAKRRPSHSKELKDSIHLEHYLELCRRLRHGHFVERCLFVSANKSDFWQDKTNPKIHPDLESELQGVGLEFFGKLEAAVGQLRI